MKKNHKKSKWSIILLSGVLFMTGCASVNSIGESKVKGLENTIKCNVEINNAINGMFISSTDEKNPVLLFLSGGPGIPEVWLNEAYNDRYINNLAEYFTVCYWDYYGEGLSCSSKINPDDITIERLAYDAHLVADYLKGKFKKDKIYLMAHSSGTNLGLYLAQTNAEDFNCYFAMGQDYGGLESVRRYEEGYKFLKAHFEEEKNLKGLKKMDKLVGISDDGEFVIKKPETIGKNWENILLQAGCGTTREMRSDAKDIFFKQMGCKCYTVSEKVNYWKGSILMGKTPFRNYSVEDARECLIPIVFLSGYYDYTTPITLAKELFDKLDAPEKAFYTFYESAHSPLWEENELVLEAMNKHVR